MKHIYASLRLGSFLCLILVASLFSALAPSDAFALGSTFDTADLLKPDTYELGLEPQYVFNTYPGANLIAHLDVGASNDGNFKFTLGSGSTNFQAGAAYKIVPIPDYQDQPGLGIFGGVRYAVEYGTSLVEIMVHPLLSKRFHSVNGDFTPYVSLPIGVTFYSGTTTVPVQLTVGNKWLPVGVKHLNVITELGLDVTASFSYLSVGISVPFDSWDTFRVD